MYHQSPESMLKICWNIVDLLKFLKRFHSPKGYELLLLD